MLSCFNIKSQIDLKYDAIFYYLSVLLFTATLHCCTAQGRDDHVAVLTMENLQYIHIIICLSLERDKDLERDKESLGWDVICLHYLQTQHEINLLFAA